MNEKKYNKTTVFLGIAVLILLAVFIGQWSASFLPKAQGSAPLGYATIWATSSNDTLIVTQANTLFATSTGCTSRIISTRWLPIAIKFGDHAAFDLTQGNSGAIQASSTVVAYDSGLYGCGLWTAVAVSSASTTATGITVTEFQGFK